LCGDKRSFPETRRSLTTSNGREKEADSGKAKEPWLRVRRAVEAFQTAVTKWYGHVLSWIITAGCVEQQIKSGQKSTGVFAD